MNGGKMSLSPWKVAQMTKQVCQRKEGDITKTNNQA